MHRDQREIAAGVQAMQIQFATLQAQMNGTPERVVELTAKIAALELMVVKNSVRIEDIKKP